MENKIIGVEKIKTTETYSVSWNPGAGLKPVHTTMTVVILENGKVEIQDINGFEQVSTKSILRRAQLIKSALEWIQNNGIDLDKPDPEELQTAREKDMAADLMDSLRIQEI